MPTDYKQDEVLEQETLIEEPMATEVAADSQQTNEIEYEQPETNEPATLEEPVEVEPAEPSAEEPAQNEIENQYEQPEDFDSVEISFEETSPQVDAAEYSAPDAFEDVELTFEELSAEEPEQTEAEPEPEEIVEEQPSPEEPEPEMVEAEPEMAAEVEETEIETETETEEPLIEAAEETEPPEEAENEVSAPAFVEEQPHESKVKATIAAAVHRKAPQISHERGTQLPIYGGFDYEKAFAANARQNQRLIRRTELKHQLMTELEKRYRELHRVSGFVKAGNALYMLGFWVEYGFVVAGRLITRLVRFGVRELIYLLSSLLTPIVYGIAQLSNGIESYIIHPIRRFFQGIANVRSVQASVEDVQEGRRNARKHFWQGIFRYWPLVKPAASWLLPAAALAMLVTVTSAMLDSTFILAVKVDGNTIGYVQNQQDFEGAKEDVSERVDAAKRALAATGNEISDEEWNIDVTYSLATEATRSGNLMSQNAMANAILEASSDQIQNGTAVYIDGVLKGILTQEDNVRFARYLADKLNQATNSESYLTLLQNPELSNVRVEYVHSIANGDEESGVYFTSSITDYDTFISQLEDTAVGYTVQSWDTLWTIADSNGITVEELCALNNISPDFEPVTGAVMNVGNDDSLLAIRQKATITWQEEIEFTSTEEKSRDLNYGVTKVVQEGENGLKKLVADIVYSNGVEESRVLTGETVLKEPVTQITQKGTKLSSGLYAQTGTGNFLWPVPNYTYVSRWMSAGHHGTDICAPFGVDVLACDSGVVITAGWHYSYGNYVVIDHGNGWQTLYGHNSQLCVSAGQPVSQGQVIAKIGSTGYSTGNHCHLEFRYNGSRVSAYTVFGGAPR